jgi:membrane protease YdiL (CAAX protease family)
MMRPTSQLGDVYGVRIILAAAWGRYKAATNFVFFVLAENDNNNEKGALDVAPRNRQSSSANRSSTCCSVQRLKVGSRSMRVRVPRKAKRVPGLKPGNWLEEHRPTSYWAATRRPFPSLLLVAPLVITYEWAVIWLGGATPGKLRTGADTWMRNALAALGVDDRWLLPLLLVVILLGWQVVSYRDWRFSPGILAGMVVESLVWAVMLVGISRLIDAGFSYLEQRGTGALAIGPGKHDALVSSLIGYVGAGIYEETLFRLILVPAFYWTLRLLQAPQILAITFAVTGSALLFTLAHHAGSPGEPFTWFAFIFRWMAGVFFAWVFVLRGFGVAVGTHAIYDILVGWIAAAY